MLYLMRHGQSIINVEGRLTCRKPHGDLTAKGRQQVEKAARWLDDKGVTALYSSSFHRAQQSATLLGERLGLDPIIDDDLREMNCGDLEGRADKAAWAEWAAVYERWLARDLEAAFPGGESFADAVERFGRALRRVPDEATAAIVTHGGVTRAVVPQLCANRASVPDTGDLWNTAFVALERRADGRYDWRGWNVVEHLIS